MRRRIAFLVAATTSAIVLAFVLPLAILVRDLAEDRARAAADTEARNVAILVSSLTGDGRLESVVAAVDERSSARTSVVLTDGRSFGSAAVGADDPDVILGREGRAFSTNAGAGLRIVVPVLTANGTDVVVTEVTEDQLHQGVRTAWLILVGLGLVLTALASAAAASAARRIATPVTAVAGVADRLREGDLAARADEEGPAETRALARALNRLGGRIQELLVTERAAAGDLAHRLRTPVTALRIDVDQVADDQVGEQLREHVGNLQRTIDAIVADARRPVRHDVDARADASTVVAERVRFWSALAEDQGRTLTGSVASAPVLVPVDESELRDVVDVLIDNVFAHTEEGTGFRVDLTAAADEVELVVADQGRWREAGPGVGRSGLGHQIVRRVATAAGGGVTIDRNAGTTVTVRLPRSS